MLWIYYNSGKSELTCYGYIIIQEKAKSRMFFHNNSDNIKDLVTNKKKSKRIRICVRTRV